MKAATTPLYFMTAILFLLTTWWWWMLRYSSMSKSSPFVLVATRLFCDDLAPSVLGDGTEEVERIVTAAGNHFGNAIMAVTIRRVTHGEALRREVVLLRWAEGTKRTWSTEARFASETKSRHWTFGMSLALSQDGNRLVVGEHGANHWAGKFHIFDSTNGSYWTEGEQPFAFQGEQGEEFGGALAMNAKGDRIAVGAMFGGPDRVGYVRIYDLDQEEGTWTEDVSARNVLVGSTTQQARGFGTELAFSASGDRLAVAYYNCQVRVFDRKKNTEGSGWTPAGQMLVGNPNQPPAGIDDNFGRSLALSASGDRLVVGAHANYGNGINAGQVRVFDWNQKEGRYIENDQASSVVVGRPGDGLGFKVAMAPNGHRIVATAPFGHPYGQVRIFDWNGVQWKEVLKGNKLLSDASTSSKGNFGYAIALTNNGEEDQVAIGKGWDSTDDAFLIRVLLIRNE